MKRFVDCLCWGHHLDDCPNYVSMAERRAFYASAIEARRAAATEIDAVHESAVAESQTPNNSRTTP